VNEFEVPFARKRVDAPSITSIDRIEQRAQSVMIQVIEGLCCKVSAMQNMPFGSSPKFPGPSDEYADSCTPSSTCLDWITVLMVHAGIHRKRERAARVIFNS
jgi:hypothetical protein